MTFVSIWQTRAQSSTLQTERTKRILKLLLKSTVQQSFPLMKSSLRNATSLLPALSAQSLTPQLSRTSTARLLQVPQTTLSLTLHQVRLSRQEAFSMLPTSSSTPAVLSTQQAKQQATTMRKRFSRRSTTSIILPRAFVISNLLMMQRT